MTGSIRFLICGAVSSALLAACAQWPGAPPGAVATPAQTFIGAKIAKLAEAQVGAPYLYGGDTPKGFDCSGLAYYVYFLAGIQVPRTAEGQFDRTSRVDRKALQAGDLVFFHSESASLLHVGIYIGSDWFVHAPESGKPVTAARLDATYWKNRYLGATRPG